MVTTLWYALFFGMVFIDSHGILYILCTIVTDIIMLLAGTQFPLSEKILDQSE